MSDPRDKTLGGQLGGVPPRSSHGPPEFVNHPQTGVAKSWGGGCRYDPVSLHTRKQQKTDRSEKIRVCLIRRKGTYVHGNRKRIRKGEGPSVFPKVPEKLGGEPDTFTFIAESPTDSQILGGEIGRVKIKGHGVVKEGRSKGGGHPHKPGKHCGFRAGCVRALRKNAVKKRPGRVNRGEGYKNETWRVSTRLGVQKRAAQRG